MRKLFLLAIVLCVWSVVADAQESERRYIEVTGSSEIEVVPDATIKIQIKYEFEFNLKLSSLLKRNFLLSSTQLRRLFEQGVISLLSGKEPQKYKVKDGDILLMDKEHLLVMMDFVDSFMVKTGID